MKNIQSKKIGIIGGGFTGLTLAYRLSKKGYNVTIFESAKDFGGLAGSFKREGWRWMLEMHYHHLFESDRAIRDLAEEVGEKIIFSNPKTSSLIEDDIVRIDSPRSLLSFKPLPIIDRVRMGIVLLAMKINFFWQPLEKITAYGFIKESMGKKSLEIVWEPLLVKKFGKYSKTIPASWFWARVKTRSSNLGYPEGGFGLLTKKIVKELKNYKCRMVTSFEVCGIENKDNQVIIWGKDKKPLHFDSVICTLPIDVFAKIGKGLPKEYLKKVTSLRGLGAVNLVIVLKNTFLKDGTYWLNINDKKIPFVGIVEQTNFMKTSNYGGEHILYIGNYCEIDSSFYKMEKKELLAKIMPLLKKINNDFSKKWIKETYLFRARFAQPIPYKNYSNKIMGYETPLKGVFLANMQQVYPWDRGTNYAVDLGNKVSRIVDKWLQRN